MQKAVAKNAPQMQSHLWILLATVPLRTRSEPWRSPTATKSPLFLSRQCLELIGLFRWPDRPELPVQHKVVRDFERPGNEERNINQRGTGEQEAGKDRADRGSRGPRYARDSTSRRALLGSHHSHRVGLPGRHIHLTDAESDEQYHDRERQVRHQRHKEEQYIRRHMRDHHSPHEPDARRKARGHQRRNSRENVGPEENEAELHGWNAECEITPKGRG